MKNLNYTPKNFIQKLSVFNSGKVASKTVQFLAVGIAVLALAISPFSFSSETNSSSEFVTESGSSHSDSNSALHAHDFSLLRAALAEAGGSGEFIGVPENKIAGTWRDGKAVFSDIKLLDFFLKYSRGYTPKQPVNYSHVVHVKKLGIECQYCHTSVNKSSYATVPPLETCLGCHKVVGNVAGEEGVSEEIAKLRKHWEEKTPVEWEPVNHLPEHAVFNHERHVKAGVGCQNCHGQVQEMDVVEKVSSLKMGFCVSCHRERGASIDCAVCHH